MALHNKIYTKIISSLTFLQQWHQKFTIGNMMVIFLLFYFFMFCLGFLFLHLFLRQDHILASWSPCLKVLPGLEMRATTPSTDGSIFQETSWRAGSSSGHQSNTRTHHGELGFLSGVRQKSYTVISCIYTYVTDPLPQVENKVKNWKRKLI